MDLLNFIASLQNAAVTIGVLLLAVLLAIGFRWFIATKKDTQVWIWSQRVVLAVQQQWKDLPPERKKELAVMAVRAFSNKIGAKLSDEEIDKLIEAAVFLMKQDYAPLAAG